MKYTIEPDDLDQITPTTAKDEQVPTVRVLTQNLLGYRLINTLLIVEVSVRPDPPYNWCSDLQFCRS